EAGRDVSVQVADARLPSRNRPQLRRKTPLHGHPFDSKSGRSAEEEAGFQQPDQRVSRRIQVGLTVFNRGLCRPLRKTCWAAAAAGRPAAGEVKRVTFFPQSKLLKIQN